MEIDYRPEPVTAHRLRGIDVAVLADQDATGGTWEAIHQRVEPGGGSPLHRLGADKLFVVLDGELVLVIDGDEHPASAGASATVPAGTPHRFENRSGSVASLLVVTSGGGHVQFLAGMAELAANGPVGPELLADHAARWHVELLS